MTTKEYADGKMIAQTGDGIGWMIFNQPAKRNAMTYTMWEAIPPIMESFQNDPDVRVVGMKGAGDKAFVSGADISEFDSMRASPEQTRQVESHFKGEGLHWRRAHAGSHTEEYGQLPRRAHRVTPMARTGGQPLAAPKTAHQQTRS